MFLQLSRTFLNNLWTAVFARESTGVRWLLSFEKYEGIIPLNDVIGKLMNKCVFIRCYKYIVNSSKLNIN